MIDHTTLIQRNPAIVFSQLDEEYLALDAEAGFCYRTHLDFSQREKNRIQKNAVTSKPFQ
jgi:hypothetical protein